MASNEIAKYKRLSDGKKRKSPPFHPKPKNFEHRDNLDKLPAIFQHTQQRWRDSSDREDEKILLGDVLQDLGSFDKDKERRIIFQPKKYEDKERGRTMEGLGTSKGRGENEDREKAISRTSSADRQISKRDR